MPKINTQKVLNYTCPHTNDFRALHSTSSILTNLTQLTTDGINSARLPDRTLLTTLDISKATDGILRRKLITKIYKTWKTIQKPGLPTTYQADKHMNTSKASHHKHVISQTEYLKALFFLLHFSTSTCTTCQHSNHIHFLISRRHFHHNYTSSG